MKCSSTLTALLLLALSGSALAAEPTAQPVGCIDVSVGGYKAPDYNCLSQQMSDPEQTQARQKNQEALNPDISKKAPNKLGLATPAATSVRMGNTFGTSVMPQRPPAGQ
ncbi:MULTISPECIES: hypothetical protein [Pseudomonas]|uniref:hypothetical protein n=1 Tax=Pseudomonas TaxID=286 RepID=UPI000CD4B4F0|nr:MULTISPECIES: hypothetical protein [Pseudomonas]RBH56557.1 hypothetical protein C3F00_014680 [Pseudomonas sp. MWU13-2860]